MKNIKEAEILTGVTKRTLQFYDTEKLVRVKRSEKNYRLYDEETLSKIWQILLYKEMGLNLNEIKLITGDNNKDNNKLLDKKIRAIEEEKTRLSKQIKFIEGIKNIGLPPVFNVDKEEMISYVNCIKLVKKLIADKAIVKELKPDSKEESCSNTFELIEQENSQEFEEKFLKWIERKWGKKARQIISKQLYFKRGENRDDNEK